MALITFLCWSSARIVVVVAGIFTLITSLVEFLWNGVILSDLLIQTGNEHQNLYSTNTSVSFAYGIYVSQAGIDLVIATFSILLLIANENILSKSYSRSVAIAWISAVLLYVVYSLVFIALLAFPSTRKYSYWTNVLSDISDTSCLHAILLLTLQLTKVVFYTLSCGYVLSRYEQFKSTPNECSIERCIEEITRTSGTITQLSNEMFEGSYHRLIGYDSQQSLAMSAPTAAELSSGSNETFVSVRSELNGADSMAVILIDDPKPCQSSIHSDLVKVDSLVVVNGSDVNQGPLFPSSIESNSR